MRWTAIPCAGKISIAAVLALSLWYGAAGKESGAAAAASPDMLYEAEDARTEGTVIAATRPGFSGTGYVTGFEHAGEAVRFTVNVEADGFYPLKIGYASPFGDKTNYVEVNGSTAGEKLFPQTEAFTEIDFGQVQLEEGENEIRISTYWGYFDVDYIRLGAMQPRPAIPKVTPKLATPQPSREAQALMDYMTSRYGKNILSGQQRTSSEELNYIYRITGKLPAMAGFTATDFGDNALEWAKYGGIVSVEWHWPAPMGGHEFFASKTTFDVAKAVTPGTEENRMLLRDLDEMAEKLLRFKQAGIPVVWRPLHEAEGGWFWWGAKGPETAKRLYNLMFDRFTGYHGLDNLIWVWTTSDTIHSKDWYPGDDKVDIIGVDRYIRDGDYSPLLSVYDTLVNMTGGKKLVAYLENGPIPDPRQLKKNKVGWMYFNTWNGKFLMDGKVNAEQHLRTVYNHPYVITLDKFPSQTIYGKPPEPYPYPARKEAPQPVTAH
ncbi:glycosyl hydrolase [Paenibacillus elgii]|uniref:glycosyl hydrolase n=1 Tax=Paenibacillus elgii TaxID=189691 RepID=UPI000FDBF54B|nr:glycosyl hydrolase [Paenibacillus elgii]NEN84131.1 beta-mannanase [Paenibacillus elgii]